MQNPTSAPPGAVPCQDMIRLRIDRARRKHGIPPSTFGRRALNDPNLIGDLIEGRTLRAATTLRIVDFLATLTGGAAHA